MAQRWYIFDTEAMSIQAESQVSALIGCPLLDEAEARTTMIRWAIPRQTTTGSWAFEVPTKPEHQIDAVVVDVVEFPEPILFPNETS
jgi:hypothetical protein